MISFSFFHFSQELLAVDIDRHHYKTPALPLTLEETVSAPYIREFDNYLNIKVL